MSVREFRIFAVCGLLIAANSFPSVAIALPRGCYGEITKHIAHTDYGMRPCSEFNDMSIKRIGHIVDRFHRNYILYKRDWGFKPAKGSLASHGGSELMIFDYKMKYIGGYTVIDSFEYRIIGNKLYINRPPTYGNVVVFDNGPPREIWLDGEVDGFY